VTSIQGTPQDGLRGADRPPAVDREPQEAGGHEMSASPEPRAILTAAAVQNRVDLLGAMKEALAARSVESVLVTRRTIVLRPKAPAILSGPTDPELYVWVASGLDVVTTDGTQYRSASGYVHPGRDADEAVASVAASRALGTCPTGPHQCGR
jgi:hypothetical protein